MWSLKLTPEPRSQVVIAEPAGGIRPAGFAERVSWDSMKAVYKLACQALATIVLWTGWAAINSLPQDSTPCDSMQV